MMTGQMGVITGPQILAARLTIGLEPAKLAERVKVLPSVGTRAEGSPGEPAITIAQLNTLMQALCAAGASFTQPNPAPDRGKDQLSA